MKTRGLIYSLVTVMSLLTGEVFGAAPVAVSPGSGTGVALISQECPTFSWSQVEGATAYSLKVFEMMTGDVRFYEEMERMGEAVIDVEIKAPGLSWTPAQGECLEGGKRYVWYAGATPNAGWSEGKAFEVSLSLSTGTKEVVESTVREYLITEWGKSESYRELTHVLMTELSKGGGTIIGQGSGSAPIVPSFEGNSNTLYGIGAGNSLGDDDDFATFIGYQAGYNTHEGTQPYHGKYNTFVGYQAGYSNTTGDANTFIGYLSGNYNSEGSRNVFIGEQAGQANTTGSLNTFLGMLAGVAHVTGGANTFLGYAAGYNNNNGSGNVFIGNMVGFNETGSNKLYIDNSSTSSPLIYGDFNTRLVQINGKLIMGSVSSLSDERLKKNINPLKSSLDKVMHLKGVNYEWREEENVGRGFTRDRQIGLIAQEVEAVIPEIVQTDREGYKALAYDKVVPVLIEAIKEQQDLIKELQGKNERLEQRLLALEAK